MPWSVNSHPRSSFLLFVLVLGCWTPPRTVPALPAPLPAQGASVGAAEFPDAVASTNPVEAWRIEAGRGFLGSPRVRAHVIVAAHTGRDVTVRETADGDTYWRRRFRTPITPLTVADGVVYFAERARGGDVHAITLTDADELWTSPVRHARHAPIVIDDLLVLSTESGELVALDRGTGAERWRTPLGRVLAVPPVHWGGGIAAASSGDTLYYVDAEGAVTGRTPLPATPSAPPLVIDSVLVLPLHDRTVITVNADRAAGAVVHLDDIVLAQPVRDGRGAAVVLTRAGQLVRIRDGVAAPIAELDGAATRSLARVANGYVVGLLDGTVMLMDDDGDVLWRHSAGGSVDEPVAVDDGVLYLTTRRGTLIKLVNG